MHVRGKLLTGRDGATFTSDFTWSFSSRGRCILRINDLGIGSVKRESGRWVGVFMVRGPKHNLKVQGYIEIETAFDDDEITTEFIVFDLHRRHVVLATGNFIDATET